MRTHHWAGRGSETPSPRCRPYCHVQPRLCSGSFSAAARTTSCSASSSALLKPTSMRIPMTGKTRTTVRPLPPLSCNMIRLKKSVLLRRICCTMLLRSSPSCLVVALLRPITRFTSLQRLSDHCTVQTLSFTYAQQLKLLLVRRLLPFSASPLLLPRPPSLLPAFFWAAKRSHILLSIPSASTQADDLPRELLSPITAFHLAWVTSDSFVLPTSYCSTSCTS